MTRHEEDSFDDLDLELEDESNSALDDSIQDRSDWPAHLDIEIKEASLKMTKLISWLKLNGFDKEACAASTLITPKGILF